MTQGLPRSGKSTWARSQGWPIVSPDAIRLAKTGQRWWGPMEHEVWAAARTMVRALFWAGHQIVVLDSTSYNRLQRDRFCPSRDIQWRRFVKIIDTPVLECCRRAKETYPALVEIIEQMAKNWEPVEPDEGIKLWQGIINKKDLTS